MHNKVIVNIGKKIIDISKIFAELLLPNYELKLNCIENLHTISMEKSDIRKIINGLKTDKSPRQDLLKILEATYRSFTYFISTTIF